MIRDAIDFTLSRQHDIRVNAEYHARYMIRTLCRAATADACHCWRDFTPRADFLRH